MLSTLNLQPSTVLAQGTAFIYQGRLSDAGSPANGSYDFRFAVYDAVTNGTIVGGPITNSAVAVSNGLFTVTLDFGTGIFTGPNRWLDIAVRATNVTAFTTLVPRQPVLAVPYAIFANSASNLVGNLPAAQLTGTLPASAFAGYTNTVALTNGNNQFAGTYSGNGANLTNLNASQLTSGTVADARLTTNVALLNRNQTFSSVNLFTNFGNSFVGSFFGNGLVGWVATNGTAIQAEIDHGYLLTNAQVATVTLPAAPSVGDIVRVSGGGAGGWTIAQNAGQSILGNFSSFAASPWTQSGAPNGSWKALAGSSDGSILLAANSGTGVYLSTDSGAAWSQTNALAASWQAAACSADGAKRVAAVYGGFIYTNAGKAWGAVNSTSGGNWWALAASADGNKLVAAAGGNLLNGAIYTSTDSGASWVQRNNGVSTSAHWWTITSSADGTKLAAAIYAGGVYTSSDSGASWTVRGTAPANTLGIALASSADGTALAAAVYGGRIYTSADSGVTWTTQTGAPSTNWQAIACSGDGRKLVAAVYGGNTYVSGNQGVSWLPQTNSPVQNWSALFSSSDGGQLAGTVLSGGIYTSQSSAQTSSTTGTNGYLTGVQGSAVELQYLGAGKFMPVSSAGTIWAY